VQLGCVLRAKGFACVEILTEIEVMQERVL